MPLQGQRGNVVLDALSPADRSALAPHLGDASVRKGEVLLHKGDDVRVMYFPLSADLSNSLRASDGRMIEATSVGRDGVTGLSAFLAEAPIAWDVICQVPGELMLIDADVLRRQVEASPELRRLLMRVTHENQSQAAQTSACNSFHSSTQRFSRWLLGVSDRSGRADLDLTQEQIAALLGVKRATINVVAQTLRRMKAIRFTRGKITILDRARLESAACECYRVQTLRTSALGLKLPAAERTA